MRQCAGWRFVECLPRARFVETLGVVKLPSSACASALLLVIGCGGPPHPARFSGSADNPTRGAAEVTETDRRPAGYEILGQVFSSCKSVSFVRRIDGAWLKDVVCSEGLLTEALRAKAASVGGQVLVGRRCTSREEREDGERGVARRCRAQVARAENGSADPARAKFGRSVLSPDEEELFQSLPPVDAWRVEVSVVPAKTTWQVRPPRRLDRVGDLPDIPPSQVRFGDVVAQCHGVCAHAGLRQAVRAAAGRVGADDVVGVACIEGGEGSLCTGQATVYEVRPELLPE